MKVNYVGYREGAQHYERIWRPDGSGDYLFLFFMTSMHVCLDDEIAVASPGSCIIFTPGQEQDYSALREFVTSFVHFSATEEEIRSFGLPLNTVFDPGDGEYIDRQIRELRKEFFTALPLSDIEMDALLSRLFVSAARLLRENAIENESDRKMYNLFCQARFTMLSNCESEWSSTNMGEMVGLSRSQFYKYYDEFFGVSPIADLAKARIEKAKSLLTNKNYQVTEVASMCGYASIHHFSRTFKEYTGLSPLAYVKHITGKA